MNIFITGNKSKKLFSTVLSDLYEYLSKNYSCNIFIDEFVKTNNLNYKYDNINSGSNSYDIVFCIGGDGSI